MAKRQGGLGKYGVDAIFSELKEDSEGTELNLDQLSPNPFQPRSDFDQEKLDELAQSIKEHGIIQPIVVRHVEGKYQIVAGERRWRAAQIAGLEKVPVVVKEMDDASMMQMALIENVQREDLNPMEEAEGYRVLTEQYGLTQEEAAARVGKSRPAVANALRLLVLPQEVRDLVEQGELSAGHARAVLSLPTQAKQKAAAQRILALRLSVRQAEAMCKRMAAEEKKPEPPKQPAVNYVAECEKALTRRLDRKVRIVNGKRKGRFELEFYGQDDLQRLYEALLALDPSEGTHGE